MSELALKIIKPFAGALLILALLFIARQVGYSAGVVDTIAAAQKADIESLNKSISDLNTATKAAGEANIELSKTINARKKSDQQSTQVFVNALTKTAHLRVGCEFDNGVMQQLYKAASAADATTTSGITNSMPARDPPR